MASMETEVGRFVDLLTIRLCARLSDLFEWEVIVKPQPIERARRLEVGCRVTIDGRTAGYWWTPQESERARWDDAIETGMAQVRAELNA